MKELLGYFNTNFGAEQLGDITWAHAVNNKLKLSKTVNDPDIMFVESDIRRSISGTIVAAHPPETESDLTLTDLIKALQTSIKGLKLDFKDPEIFADSLRLLLDADLKQPVLLNAGILQGNGAPLPKFDAAGFIATCKREYPKGILSVDWTSTDTPGSYYSEKNIDEMLMLCRDFETVTFPVRALYLPNSWNNLQRLIKREGYSLTVWNNEPVNDELKDWIRENTDPKKTMYDFINSERESVRLW